jgi:TrmH family RNA methyltransferase
MIPLAKLASLPRHQRLRKAEKVLNRAERGLLPGGGVSFTPEERVFLGDLLGMLAEDPGFSGPERRVFAGARGASGDEFRRVVNGARHVLLAAMGRYPADWDFLDSRGGLDGSRGRFFPGVRVYLEDIRSPFNVGAIFRTAESFGVEKLWLSPLCADPAHPRAKRSAMGCVEILPWERLPGDPWPAVPEGGPPLLSGPFFALETGGVPLGEFPFPRRGTMIIGSEELGVSPAALAASGASLGRVSIPTFGAKASLNAAAAFAIAMQKWAERLGDPVRKIPQGDLVHEPDPQT